MTQRPISLDAYLLDSRPRPSLSGARRALVEFLWWAIHDGEAFTKDLNYASLPADIVKRAEAKINSITANGTPLR